ncbi:septum formation initiator, partial [Streptomyces paradoxus]
VKQALWALAGELGLAGAPEEARKGHGRFRGDRGSASFRRRKDGAG